jgi:energy-coupling factor transporter ATP-binding protein EcfA2
MSSFYKKHQPATFNEVAGHDSAKRKLVTLNKSCGLKGQVFWFTGESGTGKNTLAEIIARIVSPEASCRYDVDAQDVTLDLLREWETKAKRGSLFGGYCFTINEAHGMSSKVVSRLQTLLEDDDVQANSTWIFTTTFQGEARLFDSRMDACPFLSRAISIRLELDEKTAMAMAERLLSIARSEELDGKPIDDYVKLLTECNFNMRQALQRIACGEMLD